MSRICGFQCLIPHNRIESCVAKVCFHDSIKAPPSYIGFLVNKSRIVRHKSLQYTI